MMVRNSSQVTELQALNAGKDAVRQLASTGREIVLIDENYGIIRRFPRQQHAADRDVLRTPAD